LGLFDFRNALLVCQFVVCISLGSWNLLSCYSFFPTISAVVCLFTPKTWQLYKYKFLSYFPFFLAVPTSVYLFFALYEFVGFSLTYFWVGLAILICKFCGFWFCHCGFCLRRWFYQCCMHIKRIFRFTPNTNFTCHERVIIKKISIWAQTNVSVK